MFEHTISSLAKGIKKSYHSRTYTPTDAIIFLTYRCTSRCTSCNIWKREVKIDEELQWEDWKPVLNDLFENGIRSIEMFGGDALLRKDLLLKMIRHCSDNDVATFFPTNSSSLTSKTIKSLVEAGLGTIYLSLDEVPEIGESVRGVKRHFERVTRNISLIREIRGESKTPKISCITTVSGLNYRYLEQMISAAHELGADEYMVRGISEFTNESVDETLVDGVKPSPYFMPTDGKSHAFTREEALEFREVLSRVWVSRSSFLPMSIDITNLREVSTDDLVNLTYPHQMCVFATTQVVISPFGNVLPCLYFKNYHLGNLEKESIADLWGSPSHRRFCGQQKKGEIPLCDHCSIKYYHKSFLPAARDVWRSAKEKAVMSRA